MLLREANDVGVQFFLNTTASEVQHDTEFTLRTDHSIFRSPILVIATGGLSIPKMGATDFGYSVARKFGLKIVEPWPALVPLVLLTRRKDVMGALVNRRLTTVVAAIVATLISLLNIFLLAQTFGIV